MATREDLHRRVDALSEAQVERARIVVVDEVAKDTSVESILVRHGEQQVGLEEFEEHFGDPSSATPSTRPSTPASPDKRITSVRAAESP